MNKIVGYLIILFGIISGAPAWLWVMGAMKQITPEQTGCQIMFAVLGVFIGSLIVFGPG